jgi:hypothetical protein
MEFDEARYETSSFENRLFTIPQDRSRGVALSLGGVEDLPSRASGRRFIRAAAIEHSWIGLSGENLARFRMCHPALEETEG